MDIKDVITKDTIMVDKTIRSKQELFECAANLFESSGIVSNICI